MEGFNIKQKLQEYRSNGSNAESTTHEEQQLQGGPAKYLNPNGIFSYFQNFSPALPFRLAVPASNKFNEARQAFTQQELAGPNVSDTDIATFPTPSPTSGLGTTNDSDLIVSPEEGPPLQTQPVASAPPLDTNSVHQGQVAIEEQSKWSVETSETAIPIAAVGNVISDSHPNPVVVSSKHKTSQDDGGVLSAKNKKKKVEEPNTSSPFDVPEIKELTGDGCASASAAAAATPLAEDSEEHIRTNPNAFSRAHKRARRTLQQRERDSNITNSRGGAMDLELDWLQRAKVNILSLFYWMFALYEEVEYNAVTFIDDRFEKARVLSPYRLQSAQVSEYLYIQSIRRNPIWVGIFKILLQQFCASILVLSVIWYYGMPASRHVQTLLLANDHNNVVSLEKPLEVQYLSDFINDYINTASANTKTIDKIRAANFAMEDARTEAERIALSVTNSLSKDGNDIADQYELKSWDAMASNEEGFEGINRAIYGNSYSYTTGSSTDSKYHTRVVNHLKVSPITPTALPLCDYASQYLRSIQGIIVKQECKDVTRFALDYVYNRPYYCRQLLADMSIVKEASKRGQQHIATINKLRGVCEQLLDSFDEKAASRETICISNLDYGQTNPWVYTAKIGHEPFYLMDYEIIARNYSDFLQQYKESLSRYGKAVAEDPLYKLNVEDFMNEYVFNEDPNTPLGALDIEFWKQIKADPIIKQPSDGIFVNAYLLPSDEKKQAYFGNSYGSAIAAFGTAQAAVIQNRTKSEAGIDGWIFGKVNQLGHYLNRGSEDLSAIDEIFASLIRARAETAATHRRYAQGLLNQNQHAPAEDANYLEMIKRGAFNLLGKEYETKEQLDRLKILDLEYPEIEYRTNIRIPPPFSQCIQKAKLKQDLLDIERQKVFDQKRGLKYDDSHYKKPTYKHISDK